MNLIHDAWIPVATTSGQRAIRPHQITEADVLFPAWPRADLNIACLELLIGLVALADPPADPEEWEERRAPDPARLRAQLAPLASAFELDGEGLRFLQDLEALEGEPAPPDMLFIDSAGASTAKKNGDLMVWRDRYPTLSPELAAMALYTLQAHAPSGGAGNRTSMRGGGPLVTLVEPRAGCPLWDLVWANTPCGAPQGAAALPWMQPTRVSDKGQETPPPEGGGNAIEAFFGMPRRLRLVFAGDRATGVVQRPWGARYRFWRHPLTPYYRLKVGEEWLPVHPRAGRFGYRNWLGVVAQAEDSELRHRAETIGAYAERVLEGEEREARVIVAGWAMDNMTPRDFILSRQPLLALDPERTRTLHGMVNAAESFGVALRQALKCMAGEGAELESLREEFFLQTEGPFQARLADLVAGAAVAQDWLHDMRRAAFGVFDALARPGLADRRIVRKAPGDNAGAATGAAAIIAARQFLRATFAGYGKFGQSAYERLGLPPPETKKARKAG